MSYNEFSVQHDPDAFKAKLEASKTAFNKVWESVRSQVEGVVECVSLSSRSSSLSLFALVELF